jgi:hypothetical protein
MIGTGLAILGAGLLGAGASMYGASKASSAQENAGNKAAAIQQQGMDYQKQNYESAKGNLTPFINTGTGANNLLASFYGINGSDPGAWSERSRSLPAIAGLPVRAQGRAPRRWIIQRRPRAACWAATRSGRRPSTAPVSRRRTFRAISAAYPGCPVRASRPAGISARSGRASGRRLAPRPTTLRTRPWRRVRLKLPAFLA